VISKRRRLRATHLVLGLACAIYFITYMDRVNLATAAHYVAEEFHLSKTQLGLVFSAYSYPYAALQPFGGMLADRFGARLTFGVFGSLFAAATVLTGLISGFAPLLAVRALVGLGEGPSLAVATRAIADWLPASQWSFAQGLTHAFSRVANAATAPMVAGLIVLSGWRGAFVAVGAITILWVALWVWYYRDDPRDHAGITPAELSVLAPSSRKRMPSGFYVRLLRRMAPVVATDFCYGWTLFVVLNWLPSFFRGAFHFDLSLSTAFTAGTFVAGIGGDILGGVLSASLLRRTGDLRIARRNLIAAALFASAVCYTPVLLTHAVPVVTASIVLGFFCMELAIAPLWSVPMDITPEHAGAASGMMNFGAALAGIASPWAFGWIVDRTGDWNLPFAATVALMLAGSGLAFLMRPERRFDAGAVP
jgi:MFS family permease